MGERGDGRRWRRGRRGAIAIASATASAVLVLVVLIARIVAFFAIVGAWRECMSGLCRIQIGLVEVFVEASRLWLLRLLLWRFRLILRVWLPRRLVWLLVLARSSVTARRRSETCECLLEWIHREARRGRGRGRREGGASGG